jgi:hypothetical protein
MVWYKYDADIQKSNSEAYDKVLSPGEVAPWSGVYRCGSCAAEMVIDIGRTLPPTHAGAAHGHRITWRLVAYPHHLT